VKTPVADDLFGKHVKAVEQFLSEMYATMIDPCSEGTIKVDEMCRQLLEIARQQREQAHTFREQQELALGAILALLAENLDLDKSVELQCEQIGHMDEELRQRNDDDRLHQNFVGEVFGKYEAELTAVCRALTLNSNAYEYATRLRAIQQGKLREILSCAREGKFSAADWKRLVEVVGA
jgi:hypothetical protein